MDNYVKIKDTDLNLYRIGLGTTGAGLDWDGLDADRLIDAYLSVGGNLIDTARVYSDWIPPEKGRSERVIGEWIRRSGKRNQVIIMTKGGHPDLRGKNTDMHKPRCTREEMRHDLELSLKILGTDVIDIYFYHRDDTNLSVEEEVETMEDFRREGKIRYYGCSNWTYDRIAAADAYCRKHEYRGFVADQALLNLGMKYMNPLRDDTMVYIRDDLENYHRETPGNLAMPYMGAAGGFFHLYAMGGAEAVKSSPYMTPGNIATAERVLELMERYGATVSQVVLGYFTCVDFACVPLYGPQNIAQLKDAVKSLDFCFRKDDFVV